MFSSDLLSIFLASRNKITCKSTIERNKTHLFDLLLVSKVWIIDGKSVRHTHKLTTVFWQKLTDNVPSTKKFFVHISEVSSACHFFALELHCFHTFPTIIVWKQDHSHSIQLN